MIIYDNDGRVVLDVTVDDNSYRHRAIMGDHNITLYYSLAEHVGLPVGAYCVYQGETFTLERPENFKMKHTRHFEYTVTMEGNEAKAKKWKLRNTVDGRLKFPLTAKPREHLQMFVDNMNRRDTGWTLGDCIDGTEKLISYNHNFCYDALTQIAAEFDTEFEIVEKRVSLRKVEYNKNNPLPLSYGRGNGFKPGVGRSNSGDNQPVEILFVQGGSENIDRSTYGSSELLLPKNQTISYDGEYFEDEDAYNPANARSYIVDDKGLSIRRADKQLSTQAEDSLDASDIYPKRVGTVSEVVSVDVANNFYDITDKTIPVSLDFNDCLIEGEKLTIIFQSGMLVTREFEATYFHNSVDGKPARRFELVPIEVDGMNMPSGDYIPRQGDTYAVFKCSLPDSYICDNATKSGASWDMFRTAVKYMFDHEEHEFTFTGELDGIWAKKDWLNIGGRIKLGGYILFSDARFQKQGVLVRITGIKDYINNPHSPEIELSNSTKTGGFSSTLRKLENEEVVVEEFHRDSIQFTKRRFRDAKETISMLEEALLNNFSNSINPLTVATMAMLVGDESLQFRFVNNKTNPVTVACNITYDNASKQLTCAAGIVQHLTLNIKSISPSHSTVEYKFWDVEKYISAAIGNPTSKYYLYIKASRTTSAASFLLSEKAIGMYDNGNFYHLLVGLLNSEYDDERSFVTLYGFTEILPGRITTDRIVSSEGTSYFDMVNNAMKLGSALDFNSQGDGKLRLQGTLVQSQSGTESYIGCYRGVYNNAYTYYNGDEVIFTVNGNTSTYRYIYATPAKGQSPTNTTYWQVVAAGSKGEPGENGINGKDGISPNTAYKSTVFLRANTKPALPIGGSYASPVPSGWNDGIPNGEAKLWASTRVFSSDGQPPQQAAWTDPKQMTDTSSFDVEFSSVANPSAPKGHPNTNTQWSNTSNSSTIWMATCNKSNGVWEEWQMQRIKGEKGEDGTSIKIKGTLTSESQLPNPPADTSDCYIIGQNLYVWDGDSWVNVGQFKGDNGNNGADGANAYVHIKYAKSSTRDDWSDNNGETPSNYIGIYCDNLPTDQLIWDKYTWTKWKGEDGFGYEYIYKLTSTSSAPATPTSTSQNDDYVPSGWNDNPPSVSATYKYCWLCYRKKTSGIWSAFIGSSANTAVAALWAKYGTDGSNGSDGDDGSDGKDGQYTELRFAKNGSTTVAPSITKTALSPSGWTTSTPSVGTGEYLWMSTAIKSGDGKTLVSQWTTPIRITPYNGKDGENGKSPAMLYRGIYDSSKTYYGNANRLDCVKYGSNYYIARIDAGTFKTPAPPDTSKWNDFGASFESVATNLLLAENANIAGWVFRNNRLESENGSVYLDGVSGEVRLAGTMQYSTGYSGNYSDVNMFFLPARTTSKNITMGYEKSDIGKVCRLYNNSAIGSGGIYYVYLYTFGISENITGTTTDTTFGTVKAILKPQEVLEVSCFELPPRSLGSYPICAKWTITSRFSTDNWVNQPSDNTPMGRFPRMLAMGHLYGTDRSASVSGYFFDGRSLGSLFRPSRVAQGHYRIAFSSGLLGEGYTVMAVGSGTIYGGSHPVYASVQSKYQSYFDVYLGDDASRNDGSFDFMVLSPYWYYPL